MVGKLAGTGIVPRARSSRRRLVKAVDQLWQAFAETAGADGLTDRYGLQAPVARTLAERGEVLARPGI